MIFECWRVTFFKIFFSWVKFALVKNNFPIGKGFYMFLMWLNLCIRLQSDLNRFICTVDWPPNLHSKLHFSRFLKKVIHKSNRKLLSILNFRYFSWWQIPYSDFTRWFSDNWSLVFLQYHSTVGEILSVHFSWKPIHYLFQSMDQSQMLHCFFC